MREIKFRAWDSKNKIMMWCPSGPIGDFVFTRPAYGAIELVPLKVIIYQLVWPQPKTGIHYYEYERYKLMQYTGLKDKNGVEIYEGDLLSSDHLTNAHNAPQIVTYSELPIHGDYQESYGYTFDYRAEELEVVGNIYENEKK